MSVNHLGDFLTQPTFLHSQINVYVRHANKFPEDFTLFTLDRVLSFNPNLVETMIAPLFMNEDTGAKVQNGLPVTALMMIFTPGDGRGSPCLASRLQFSSGSALNPAPSTLSRTRLC